MKKFLLTAVSVLSLSALSSEAFAGCDGIYLAARGGIVNHNLGDPDEAFGDRMDVDDNELIAAGAIGYRWGYFRFEGEYTWRDKSESEDNMTIIPAKTDFQSQSYMFNVYYDFSPYTMFTPYAQVGLGMTHVEQNFSGGGGASESFEADNFTWALGGGISAKITNRFNVDVGYRFLNMGDLEESSLRAHEVYAGLRYVF